jgi:hypothetical protein
MITTMVLISLAFVVGYLFGQHAEKNRAKPFDKFGPHFWDLP